MLFWLYKDRIERKRCKIVQPSVNLKYELFLASFPMSAKLVWPVDKSIWIKSQNCCFADKHLNTQICVQILTMEHMSNLSKKTKVGKSGAPQVSHVLVIAKLGRRTQQPFQPLPFVAFMIEIFHTLCSRRSDPLAITISLKVFSDGL